MRDDRQPMPVGLPHERLIVSLSSVGMFEHGTRAVVVDHFEVRRALVHAGVDEGPASAGLLT